MGLYTALALANRLPQMVNSGLMVVNSKIPAKLITRYGVHAMNHKEMVIKATLASLHSALVLAASADRRDATFIFLACSRICFSWAATACTHRQKIAEFNDNYEYTSFIWLKLERVVIISTVRTSCATYCKRKYFCCWVFIENNTGTPLTEINQLKFQNGQH